MTRAAKIVGIDPSAAFVVKRLGTKLPIRVWRWKSGCPITVLRGRNFRPMSLVARSGLHPRCAERGKRNAPRDEGRRVVASTMWDRGRANELQQSFWSAAVAADPTAKLPQRPGLYGSGEALSGLWKSAGLTLIELTDL